MNEWKAAKHLGSYIWKRERLGILCTLLFALYTGAIVSLNMDEIWGNEKIASSFSGLTEWIYFTIFPIFGTAMNKTAFGMWRDDHYSKRLAHWRTMPIPLAVIVKVRYVQSMIAIPIIGIVFIFLQYGIAPNLREHVSSTQWLENGIVWICYALIANVLYIWFELGFNSKKYVLFYMVYALLMAIVVAICSWQGIHLFVEALGVITDGKGWLLIVISLIITVAATWLGYRVTIDRIRTRSMTI